MCELDSRHVLGVDFDNVVAKTDEGLGYYVQSRTPGRYTTLHFGVSEPGKKFPEEFENIRSKFLSEPSYLFDLALHPEIKPALELTSRFFDPILLISARTSSQRPSLNQLLGEKQLLPYFSAMLLNSENQSFVAPKVANALDAGITDMVDDDGRIAIELASHGIRVALLDRPYWNRWVPESESVIRFGEFIDYATLMAYYGSPEELFEYHCKYRLGRSIRYPKSWRASHEERKDQAYKHFVEILLSNKNSHKNPVKL